MLQNAIDWASRPPDQPFKDKPVAIMGASTGRLGTVRMQHGLRATLESLEAHALLKPEVMITFARTAFDDDGPRRRQGPRGRRGAAAGLRRLGPPVRRALARARQGGAAQDGALRGGAPARYATHIPLA